MQWNNNRIVIFLALFFSAIILYLGWKEFIFLTDDAFIAFRYVSNSILGNGYTWNPPPFHPVEGYTSFLWVIILEYVWRIFQVPPPQSANIISLIFSFGTILLTVFAVMRIKLNRDLSRYRIIFLLLILIGVLSNVTFLTWSSSGLETALFNFCITFWLVIAIFSRRRNHFWMAGLTFAAALTYLSRPDGILVWLATLLIALLTLIGKIREGKLNWKWIPSLLILMIPVIHLLWRKSYYGEWLPNTYYAKYVSAWPAAGIKYFVCFCIEYGLWIWCLVLITATVLILLRQRRGIGGNLYNKLLKNALPPGASVCTFIAVGTVAAQVAYYTLIIGGDHFEWRVYSHLVPLFFLSLLYLLNQINLKPKPVIAVIVITILFSYPISWTNHKLTRDIKYAAIKQSLRLPVTNNLPVYLHWLTVPYDNLQCWLQEHLICVRRIKHKLFCEFQLKRFPPRTLDLPPEAGKFPVADFTTVGVPGWVLPRVNIIDTYGLNDYVIARCPAASLEGTIRRMAHDRTPPSKYIETYIPNVGFNENDVLTYFRRPPEVELTAEYIRQAEDTWQNYAKHGVDYSKQY